MKKYLLLLLFSLFLIIPIGANASTKNVGISFDANEHYNYFYEQKNNTPFYRFLLSQGDNLLSYLDSIYKLNDSNKEIFIGYSKDYGTCWSGCSFDGDRVPENSKYVIITSGSSFNNFYLTNSGDNFYFNSSKVDYFDFGNHVVAYFFDENANYLSYNYLGSSSVGTALNVGNLKLDGLNVESYANFSYLISTYYNGYYSNPTEVSYNKIVVTDLYIDGKKYLIDDNSNYSNFLSFIRTLFTSAEEYNVVNTNLEYFKNNAIISNNSSLLPLYKILNSYSQGVSVPNGFTSVEVPNIDGIYLVPKVTNANANSNIYISSNGFPKIRIAYWSLVDGVVSYLGNDKRTEEEIIRSNTVGYFNIMPKLENNDLYFYNYLYHFSYQYASSEVNSPLKFTYTLYYNPDVFDVVYYSNELGVVFNYPGSDLEVVLTPDDIANNNYSGATSENIFATDYGNGSLGEYFDWLDSISTNPDGSITFASVLSKIIDFVKSFGLIISSIFSMVTLVFSSLPEEVQIILLFGMFTGFVIIIYKLIRG